MAKSGSQSAFKSRRVFPSEAQELDCLLISLKVSVMSLETFARPEDTSASPKRPA